MSRTPNSGMPKSVPSIKGGFILTSGVSGHRGGSGRPPNEIRSTCREGFDAGLQHAALVAQGIRPPGATADPTYADAIRAMKVLSRYGMERPETIVPAQLESSLSDLLRKYVPPEERSTVLLALFNSLLDGPTEAPAQETPIPKSQ